MTFLPSNMAWLKAWVIHAWAVTVIILFSHADRKPFRKWYYVLTWWITTVSFWGIFCFQLWFTWPFTGYICDIKKQQLMSEWSPCFNGDFTRTGFSLYHMITCDSLSQFKFHVLLYFCLHRDGILWIKMILEASLSEVETKTIVSRISSCQNEKLR